LKRLAAASAVILALSVKAGSNAALTVSSELLIEAKWRAWSGRRLNSLVFSSGAGEIYAGKHPRAASG
jgi:hypothetical protein